MSDAPQWLIPSWSRACLEAKATAPLDDIEHAGQRLLDRWQEPTRHYHTVKHLTEVLSRVDELVEETHAPALVRIAAWYHGAIFHHGQGRNGCRPGEDEVASSDLAEHELAELGIPPESVARVCQLVRSLERHSPEPDDYDGAALCDADLAILAAEPQKYSRYLKGIREEYSHLPLVEYLRARECIASKILARKHIFVSPRGRNWEDPARQNLQVELHKVRKELKRLSEESSPPEPVVVPEPQHGPGKRVH